MPTGEIVDSSVGSRLGEKRTMSDSLKKFDYENYVKERLLQILNQNAGVKLTAKTLTGLAHIGFRLIPPLSLEAAG